MSSTVSIELINGGLSWTTTRLEQTYWIFDMDIKKVVDIIQDTDRIEKPFEMRGIELDDSDDDVCVIVGKGGRLVKVFMDTDTAVEMTE